LSKAILKQRCFSEQTDQKKLKLTSRDELGLAISSGGWVLVPGILLSLSATYFLCNVSVQETWRIRFESAKTEQEIERASADGANLVFTAFFFAPLKAAAYTGLRLPILGYGQ